MITNSYLRAIRGPVVLITLGALFQADHSGWFSIWRTWPLLLVVLGLMILIERLFTPAPGGRP
jgi:hypothetical protein